MICLLLVFAVRLLAGFCCGGLVVLAFGDFLFDASVWCCLCLVFVCLLW